MYYIYHIPNVKIGCSTQPKKRIEKQGFSSFEILETHDCIDRASVRELELQEQYGYTIDRMPYKESVRRRPKFTKEQQERGRDTMKKNGLSTHTLTQAMYAVSLAYRNISPSTEE